MFLYVMGRVFNGVIPYRFLSRTIKMAGNTRGKLKEHFEGIHRNFDWILYHCQKCLELIATKNPGLTKAIKSIAKGVEVIDKIVQKLYARL